jgi:hypothetical protein
VTSVLKLPGDEPADEPGTAGDQDMFRQFLTPVINRDQLTNLSMLPETYASSSTLCPTSHKQLCSDPASDGSGPCLAWNPGEGRTVGRPEKDRFMSASTAA